MGQEHAKIMPKVDIFDGFTVHEILALNNVFDTDRNNRLDCEESSQMLGEFFRVGKGFTKMSPRWIRAVFLQLDVSEEGFLSNSDLQKHWESGGSGFRGRKKLPVIIKKLRKGHRDEIWEDQLYRCIATDQQESIESLLGCVPSLNSFVTTVYSSNQYIPTFEARSCQVLRKMLEIGKAQVNPNQRLLGQTLLLHHVKLGSFERVCLLLNMKADVNACNVVDGSNCLHNAVGHYAIMVALLSTFDKGHQCKESLHPINMLDKSGVSPLGCSIAHQDILTSMTILNHPIYNMEKQGIATHPINMASRLINAKDRYVAMYTLSLKLQSYVNIAIDIEAMHHHFNQSKEPLPVPLIYALKKHRVSAVALCFVLWTLAKPGEYLTLNVAPSMPSRSKSRQSKYSYYKHDHALLRYAKFTKAKTERHPLTRKPCEPVTTGMLLADTLTVMFGMGCEFFFGATESAEQKIKVIRGQVTSLHPHIVLTIVQYVESEARSVTFQFLRIVQHALADHKHVKSIICRASEVLMLVHKYSYLDWGYVDYDGMTAQGLSLRCSPLRALLLHFGMTYHVSDVFRAIGDTKLKTLKGFKQMINRARMGNTALRNTIGDTPIHAAVRLRRSKHVVAALLDSKCKLNITNSNGDHPLHIAVKLSYTKMVSYLLEKKADINGRSNNDRWTPLHIAYANNDNKMAESLIRHGADESLRNKSGRTPEQVKGRVRAETMVRASASEVEKYYHDHTPDAMDLLTNFHAFDLRGRFDAHGRIRKDASVKVHTPSFMLNIAASSSDDDDDDDDEDEDNDDNGGSANRGGNGDAHNPDHEHDHDDDKNAGNSKVTRRTDPSKSDHDDRDVRDGHDGPDHRNGRGRGNGRGGHGSRDGSRDHHDSRAGRNGHGGRNSHGSNRDKHDAHNGPNSRDRRDGRDRRKSRDSSRDKHDGRNGPNRRDRRDSRDGRDRRKSRDSSRDKHDAHNGRDSRDSRDSRDRHGGRDDRDGHDGIPSHPSRGGGSRDRSSNHRNLDKNPKTAARGRSRNRDRRDGHHNEPRSRSLSLD